MTKRFFERALTTSRPEKSGTHIRPLHELRETTVLVASLPYFICIDTELIEHFLLRLPIID